MASAQPPQNGDEDDSDRGYDPQSTESAENGYTAAGEAPVGLCMGTGTMSNGEAMIGLSEGFLLIKLDGGGGNLELQLRSEE
ncbi:hypothetical protein [Allosalinactinospora lopnorensis]|uniref:hypothetical protein n=1 Tax=Allosalinactinospora lopnorensis TaxID=1352348 RepID=UPI0012E1B38D|nr:hypothetical protein [Allosalinactinospora lopnorensis]